MLTSRFVTAIPLLALLMLFTGCITVKAARMDPNARIETQRHGLEERYLQHGERIDTRDMAQQLSELPASRKQMRRAAGLFAGAMMLSIAGGALMGWPLGELAGGNAEPNWKPAYAGIGLFGAGLTLSISSRYQAKAAIRAHNRELMPER